MQVGLAQNVAAVLAENNQPILQRLDDAGVAFREFAQSTREQSAVQAQETAALKGRIVQLETDKKVMKEAHDKDVAALKATITTLTQTLAQLSAKVTQLEEKHNSHTHHVGQPTYTISRGTVVFSCWTAGQTTAEKASRGK